MSDRAPSEAEDLLKALGALARDQAAEPAHDPRLEALAAGELSEVELKALQDLAAEDERWAEAVELHQPLSAPAVDRFTDAVLAELGAAPEAAPAAPPAHEAEVIPLAPRRRRLMGWSLGLGGLAAAAAIAFMLTGPGASPPIPSYSLEVGQGAADVRGPAAAGGEVTALTPNTRLDLVLRPSSAVERGDAGLAAKAFLKVGDQITQWKPPLTISDGGVVELVGRAGDLLPADLRGEITLILAVGRPEALPHSPTQVAKALSGGAGPQWRLLTHRIQMTR